MLSDEQWVLLELLIEACWPKGKTPPQDLRRYCQVGTGRRLWQGLGHEHDTQPVLWFPLSGRNYQPSRLIVSLLQPEFAGG
jgi:hypothetical protein